MFIYSIVVSRRSFFKLLRTSLMLGSHCRAIRYERHVWPFVADRGISLKFQVWIRGDASRYVLIRFVALGCDMVTICQFHVSRSVTV